MNAAVATDQHEFDKWGMEAMTIFHRQTGIYPNVVLVPVMDETKVRWVCEMMRVLRTTVDERMVARVGIDFPKNK